MGQGYKRGMKYLSLLFLIGCSTKPKYDLDTYIAPNYHTSDCIFSFRDSYLGLNKTNHDKNKIKIIELCEKIYGDN